MYNLTVYDHINFRHKSTIIFIVPVKYISHYLIASGDSRFSFRSLNNAGILESYSDLAVQDMCTLCTWTCFNACHKKNLKRLSQCFKWEQFSAFKSPNLSLCHLLHCCYIWYLLAKVIDLNEWCGNELETLGQGIASIDPSLSLPPLPQEKKSAQKEKK